MANAKDLQENPNPRFLIIGDSGTHKTYFLSQIPGIYIFDFDKGMAIARGRDVEYDTFKDAPRGGRTSVEEGIHRYGSAWPNFIDRLNYIGRQIDKDAWHRPLAIDSLTTMANAAMAYVLSTTGYTGNPQIQHWGSQMQLLEGVLEQLNSWPVPLFVTAHIQRNTNDLTQVIEMLPLVTGKLAGKVSLYFDEVYYARVEGSKDKKKFTFLTESDMMHKQAKTRYGVKDGTEIEWLAVANQITGLLTQPKEEQENA
jgi:hypothetical protein